MAPGSKERTEKVSKPVDADPANEKRKEKKKKKYALHEKIKGSRTSRVPGFISSFPFRYRDDEKDDTEFSNFHGILSNSHEEN